MIRRRIIRSSAVLASSLLSFLPHGVVKAQEGPLSKRLRESVLSPSELVPLSLPSSGAMPPPGLKQEKYPWKMGIVTTTFWVGEKASPRNPVPNHASSWDVKWAVNYGGFDDPNKANRAEFVPATFVPQQNPFYVALPYNDVTKNGHKPEAPLVIPWFKQGFTEPGKTVCKGRWIAIKFKDRVAYAQWEDCGPFRTDHWQYVFGNERPKPNLNRGAGLDVSPAVRDFLGMNDTDVTDWKFVEFSEVPTGPWASYGDNNTFVMNKRAQQTRTAMLEGHPVATAGTAPAPAPTSVPSLTPATPPASAPAPAGAH